MENIDCDKCAYKILGKTAGESENTISILKTDKEIVAGALGRAAKLEVKNEKLKAANTELWRELQSIKAAVRSNCKDCSQSICVSGRQCRLWKFSPFNTDQKQDTHKLTGGDPSRK